MKKGFTIVELLVVIGILGMLMAISIAVMSRGTESALNVKCETNLRNLASACQSYGMSSGHYPLAGSVEKVSLDTSHGIRNIRKVYSELPGWLSWYSAGKYRSRPTSHSAEMGWWTSAYEQDHRVREYCYTNGALFKYISSNRDIFKCPVHVNNFKETPPAWSYVMNSYFGWDDSQGERAKDSSYHGREYGKLSRADRRLLFAEIPFMGYECDANTSSSSGRENDCTLQYREKDGGEVIGFNHKSGKRDKFALVVFADSHTERIQWPRQGLPENNLRELTQWLCEGKDVSYRGKRYEEVK